jgi:hypothetical protein
MGEAIASRSAEGKSGEASSFLWSEFTILLDTLSSGLDGSVGEVE